MVSPGLFQQVSFKRKSNNSRAMIREKGNGTTSSRRIICEGVSAVAITAPGCGCLVCRRQCHRFEFGEKLSQGSRSSWLGTADPEHIGITGLWE